MTTRDGWTVELIHGSQTITARNTALGYAPAPITMSPDLIQLSEQQNAQDLEDYGTSTIYTDGVNWDKPTAGHVEVDFTDVQSPLPWGTTEDFTMKMHINCGAQSTSGVDGVLTKPPTG